MYFDHCETPADLRRAINDFMKMQTGRRISFGEAKPKSVFVPLVDQNTDQTLREGYAEAHAVAKKIQRANPHLPSVPEPSVVPLEGLAIIGRWCADAKGVKTDPQGTREAMYFERCNSPRALREAITEFLAAPDKFAPKYGYVHHMEESYRDACIKVNELYAKDDRLSRPPVTAKHPETGLHRIVQWCIEAERATGTLAKDIDEQGQEPGDEPPAGYHLDKPGGVDEQFWVHLVQLVHAFADGVGAFAEYLDYCQGQVTDDQTKWALIRGGVEDTCTHWAAAGPLRTVPDGWPTAPEPLDFCGADGDSALEVVVSFARIICENRKDIAARAAKGQTSEMVEVEAKKLVRRLNREVRMYFSRSPGNVFGQADGTPPANARRAEAIIRRLDSLCRKPAEHTTLRPDEKCGTFNCMIGVKRFEFFGRDGWLWDKRTREPAGRILKAQDIRKATAGIEDLCEQLRLSGFDVPAERVQEAWDAMEGEDVPMVYRMQSPKANPLVRLQRELETGLGQLNKAKIGGQADETAKPKGAATPHDDGETARDYPQTDHIRYSREEGFAGIAAEDKAEWLKRYLDIKDFEAEVENIEEWLTRHPEQGKMAEARPRQYLDSQLASENEWKIVAEWKPELPRTVASPDDLYSFIEGLLADATRPKHGGYLEAVTRDKYREAMKHAVQLRRDNASLPPTPAPADDPVIGLRQLQEWCLGDKQAPPKAKPRIRQEEANIEVRRLLRETPRWDWKVKALAEKIGCSTGLISQCAAWRAYHEKRLELKREGTIDTVSLTKTLEAVLGAGGKDEVLNQLIAEQEKEEREDARQAKLYLSHEKKPKRRES